MVTDEAKRIVQDMREWHEAFRKYGKDGERCVKAFLDAADMIESLSAELERVKRERDRYWKFIEDMACDSCCGDCDKCEVEGNDLTGWEWSGAKEEKHETHND